MALDSNGAAGIEKCWRHRARTRPPSTPVVMTVENGPRIEERSAKLVFPNIKRYIKNMSRTYRKHNPRMRLGSLRYKHYRDGTVRDGTPQHYSGGCDNHGDCTYCYSNRTHNVRRQKPIVDTIEKVFG